MLSLGLRLLARARVVYVQNELDSFALGNTRHCEASRVSARRVRSAALVAVIP